MQNNFDFSVNIVLEENVINVQIEDAPPNAEYAYYVHYYCNQTEPKRAIETTRYGKESAFSYSVADSGYYYVQCFVQVENLGRVNKNTYTVMYLNKSFVNDFEQLFKRDLKTVNTINDPIDYFTVPSPQNDFCFVYNTNNTISDEKLKSWCSRNQFGITHINVQPGGYLIHDVSGAQCGYCDNRVFSGYAWANDTFYMGQATLGNMVDTRDILDCYGMFTLFNMESGKITVTSDYFGFGRVFYYYENDLLVVSNRYHLLIIILSALNLHLEIDEQMVRSIFASNVTLFRQTYTTALTVKNTFMLPITQQILISQDGIVFADKGIQAIFNNPYDYNPQDYAALIDQAKRDIIHNIDALRKCELFDDIVVDLSGGKDSRTNFAAVTNLPDAREDFVLRSDVHEPKDLETAVGINNIFGFSYYTKGDTYCQNSPLDYLRKNRSYFCGYHYLWYLETKHSHNLKKLRVAGESFESFTVRYYTDTISQFDLKNPTYEEIIEAYISLLSRQSITSFRDIASTVKAQLIDTIAQLKGCTPMEAFDNLLLFYRGTTHAGSMIRMYYTSAYCMPLQSAALLKAKRMWINHFKYNKIIFDILDALNPLMSCLPFNAEKHNKNRILAQDTLLLDERFKNCKIIMDTDLTYYNKARSECEKNTRIVINKKDEREIKRLGSIPEIVYDNCLLGLQKLMEYKGGIFKEMCMQVYFYLCAEKNDNDEVRILHNKIWSILDCMSAILTGN